MVSENLLDFASEKYNFDKNTLHFISDSTNQVYMYNKDGKGYILRFAKRPAEHIHQIKAEMDWLYYLSKNNIGVSLPLKAGTGELAVSTQYNGENYIVTSFAMVSGTFWDKNDPNRWNEKIFYNWGKVMGDMHRLTKDYRAANEDDVRGVFNGRFALMDSIKSCPTVNNIAEELIGEIMSLPKDKDSYGLIHNDMHPWNFYIDGAQINVFDFDDSLYGWFALDIGIALYHGLWWGRKDDAGNDFTNRIVENFLKGYLSANQLSDFWLAKIPVFMKYRQICKFSWFYSPETADDHQKERIYNIESDILFTDCELKSLYCIIGNVKI